MLDDLRYIHERDAQDTLGLAESQWKQLTHDFSIQLPHFDPITSVVVAGMGGSALAATLVQSWPTLNVPFEIVRNYTLPNFVSKDSLVIVSSYSGNTEEAISALHDAESRQARIVIIAAGGTLLEIAREKNYPVFEIPSGLQPRMAVFYNFTALITILEQSNLLGSEQALNELHETAEWLSHELDAWKPDVATKNNQAKQIAQDLVGKSIVMYGGPLLYPAAYKWKINFNENSKQIAWVNQYPEFNHNEFLGWTKQPIDKPYAVIDLRSSLEREEVQKRFVVTEQLLSGLRPSPIVVECKGETILKQLLWTISLGDYVSLYLALLNNLNPNPVDLIEKFKKKLVE